MPPPPPPSAPPSRLPPHRPSPWRRGASTTARTRARRHIRCAARPIARGGASPRARIIARRDARRARILRVEQLGLPLPRRQPLAGAAAAMRGRPGRRAAVSPRRDRGRRRRRRRCRGQPGSSAGTPSPSRATSCAVRGASTPPSVAASATQPWSTPVMANGSHGRARRHDRRAVAAHSGVSQSGSIARRCRRRCAKTGAATEQRQRPSMGSHTWQPAGAEKTAHQCDRTSTALSTRWAMSDRAALPVATTACDRQRMGAGEDAPTGESTLHRQSWPSMSLSTAGVRVVTQTDVMECTRAHACGDGTSRLARTTPGAAGPRRRLLAAAMIFRGCRLEKP